MAITASGVKGDTAASHKDDSVLYFNPDNATLARHDGQLGSVFAISTAYFYLGSIPEEQKLVDEFGEAYQRYQQVVPRLIPLPGRVYRPD